MYFVLDEYQREGYHSLLKIVKKHSGSFLCDGVGLGKTFIGLMLIERLIEYDRKRVALFVPKSIRKTWERELNQYLPNSNKIDFIFLINNQWFYWFIHYNI